MHIFSFSRKYVRIPWAIAGNLVLEIGHPGFLYVTRLSQLQKQKK